MKPSWFLLAFFVVACVASDVVAQDSVWDRITFYGDFRGRVELDRSSRRSDGTLRDDRDRLRVRGRFGMTYRQSDHVGLGWRLRTGDPDSRQSPHLTLGDELTTSPIALDRVYARVTLARASFWFGKNSNPFWHQNELFWDDDVSLDGIAGQAQLYRDDLISLEGRGGLFILDRPQSNTFADQSRMIAGQVVVASTATALAFTAAVSVTSIRENPEAEDERLNDLDYTFVAGMLSVAHARSSWPIRVGVDVARNTEQYGAAIQNGDQRSAYVLSVQGGSLSKSGDVLVRYTYSHIEKYAVVGPFAQDDWLRWGSTTTTESSNFSGHEVRAVVALGTRHNLTARLYRVEGIALESADAQSMQTGTRFRLDWNISF